MERPSFLAKMKAKFGGAQGPNSVKNESKGRHTPSTADRPDSKQNENRSIGNGGRGVNDNCDQEISRIDVYFAETELGMTMVEEKKTGRPIVNTVIPGREGHRLGVKVGDAVVMIEQNPISSVETFSQAVRDFPRPLCVTFERNLFKRGSGVQSQRGGGVSGAIDAIKEKIQKSKSATRTNAVDPPQHVITEEEKKERRQAALEAAEGRSKGWEKRVQRNRAAASLAPSNCKNSSPDTNTSTSQFDSKSSNPQTIASVKQAKQQEALTAEQMGYNPYTPQMVGIAQARNTVISGDIGNGNGSGPSSYPAHQLAESPPRQQQVSRETEAATDDLWETSELEIVEQVDALVAQVISSGTECASVALSTVLSMLNNVALKNDEKYRRIRLSNPGFQKRVASVPGAVDLLEMAGFALCSEGEEVILQYSEVHDGDSIPPKLKVAITVISRAHVQP